MRLNYSIIIPVYNTWNLAEKLLKSLPEREDTEIIIVDDCSTEFLDVKENLKNQSPHYKWIEAEKNRGGGAARNLGLENAKGKWVLFADSDDYFTENINSILDDHINSECDIVYMNIRRHYVDKDYNILNISQPRFAHGNIGSNQIRYHFTEPWGKLIRRDFIVSNSIKFQETMMGNDIYFSTQCDFFMKSYEIDARIAYIYVHRPDSLCHNVTVNDRVERLAILGNSRMFLYNKGISKQQWKNYVKNQYNYILTHGTWNDILKSIRIARKYKMTGTAIPALCKHLLRIAFYKKCK